MSLNNLTNDIVYFFKKHKLIKSSHNIKIQIIQGDIVDQTTDVIVNAADQTLLGGTGVDGAIHAKAGKELGKAVISLKGCNIGQAKITPGFNLKARWIIHTVAPIWDNSNLPMIDKQNFNALYYCFKNSLIMADKQKAKSISFPVLGAGAFGWHPELVAKIAYECFQKESYKLKNIKHINLICFSTQTAQIFSKQFSLKILEQKSSDRLSYHSGTAVDID